MNKKVKYWIWFGIILVTMMALQQLFYITTPINSWIIGGIVFIGYFMPLCVVNGILNLRE